LVAWLGLLVVLIGAMVAAGHGSLGAPPWSEPARWSAWAAASGAPAAALAIVRVAVLVVAGWLLVVTLVSLALAATRRGREIEVAEVLGLPIVRRVVHGALGLGLAGAAAAGGAGLGSGGGPVPVEAPAAAVRARPPTLERLGPEPVATTTTAGLDPATSATTTSVPLATTTTRPLSTTTSIPSATTTAIPMTPFAVSGPSVSPTTTTTAAVGAAAAEPVEATVPDRGPAMWTVQPGDHLWSIARRVLERHGAPAVDDDDVTPYWRTLVAANRELLPVPTNPDLLFPGDRLVVPPVPSAR
jgi:hypothetical protein